MLRRHAVVRNNPRLLFPSQVGQMGDSPAGDGTFPPAEHVDGEDLDAYARHRGVMECEAETVAHVLAGLLGIDTSA